VGKIALGKYTRNKPSQRMIKLMSVAIALILSAGAGVAQSSPAAAPAPPCPPNQSCSTNAGAADAASSSETTAPAADAPLTMWQHSQSSRFWISGQSNIIFQAHPAFHAPYSGANSLRPRGEYKTSLLGTLYLGVQLTHNFELLFDEESSGGRGISQALGLAGFTNLDVVRNPNLGPVPYIARGMFHAIIPLSTETREAERGPFSLATKLPVRRLEIRGGKFGLADFFDANTAGSDSHLQFMNWTVDNNGAYDYAADTRGYTVGMILEYQDRNWAARFAETFMPTVANGIDLQWNLRRARAENLEFELRRSLLPKRAGVLRVLGYANQANMGSYKVAIQNFREGKTPVPDITAHALQTTLKYGFGVNGEQEITNSLRIFARGGWNEGQHESYVYTEVDNTMLAGADYRGDRWGRKYDKAGLAFVSNGISAIHSQYLALGGKGFLLGDGGLRYGRENILESYYNIHLWRGVFTAPDLQYVTNPGYNRDRGPVVVPGWRLHIDY
jgi:high affinity Mn2+ porin